MIKTLVVDDSHFFRRRITECLSLDPAIKVIGEACDGQQAIDQAVKLKPDVITMDIEMPNMDGIKAVKSIMEKCPVPILMFSSLTKEGAVATPAALEAGAADFLLKEFKHFLSIRTSLLANFVNVSRRLPARSNLQRQARVMSVAGVMRQLWMPRIDSYQRT